MFKKILFALFVIGLSFSVNAQSFFKPLPKLQEPAVKKSITFPSTVTAADSIYGAIRPVLVAAAYSLPDNHLMSGAGFGYQNITYNYATQRSYCNWSINAIGFAGGAVPPKGTGDVVSYGILIGALNNTVMAGAVLNNGKVQAAISIGVNFNN